jgi:hypothetical protein
MGRVTAAGGQRPGKSGPAEAKGPGRPSLDRMPFEVSKLLGGINRYLA